MCARLFATTTYPYVKEGQTMTHSESHGGQWRALHGRKLYWLRMLRRLRHFFVHWWCGLWMQLIWIDYVTINKKTFLSLRIGISTHVNIWWVDCQRMTPCYPICFWLPHCIFEKRHLIHSTPNLSYCVSILFTPILRCRYHSFQHAESFFTIKPWMTMDFSVFSSIF